MKILKIIALLALVPSAINAETIVSRSENNWVTYSILSGTPVSILSYGISRLDEQLSDLASNDWYYEDFKQDGETGLLQAFTSHQLVDGIISPVIMIRSTIYDYSDRSNRSKASAEQLCQKLLDRIASTASVFIDEDNDFFSNLWRSSEYFTDYNRNVNIDSIQSMIYLRARVSYSGSDDLISCDRPY